MQYILEANDVQFRVVLDCFWSTTDMGEVYSTIASHCFPDCVWNILHRCNVLGRREGGGQVASRGVL